MTILRLFHLLRSAYDQYRTRRAVRTIREMYQSFGHSTDDMTDNEIIEAINAAAARCFVTPEEFCRACDSLSKISKAK